MFFPIRDENPRLRPPIMMKIIVGVTILVWFVIQGAGTHASVVASVCQFGAIPGELTGLASGQSAALDSGTCVLGSSPHWYTLVTSMFMHASWLHLIGNLWFLWVFGDNIEDVFGHLGFVIFYLACGLAAAGAQIAVDPSGVMPMVGASGAISGVMGAYIVRFPRVPVQTFVLVIVFFTVIRVPAYLMLGWWFLLQLLSGLPQLGGSHAGVAFWAHVGGFVAGAAIAALVRRDPSRSTRRRGG